MQKIDFQSYYGLKMRVFDYSIKKLWYILSLWLDDDHGGGFGVDGEWADT